MEKITTYVKRKIEIYLDNHNEYQNEFNNCKIDRFLSLIANEYYKNEKMFEFFQNLNSYIGDLTKEELVEYLETTKKGYVKARLQSDPVHFSTNPMANLIQLWDFEFYGKIIKEIDILLSKC
ncbi:MAG: hypothetical protein J6U90_03770 [Methanobrevibacter sp.]|nr:hypothetical protein [Methanobrevibacter sp.]